MSSNRQVSLSSVVAWLLWGLAAVVAVANLIVLPEVPFGYISALIAAGAATTQVTAQISRKQSDAIREAFNLGREHGLVEGGGAPLARVR